MSSYRVLWDNPERTCILTIFEPPLTWESIQLAHEEIYTMMRETDQRVDWINDISGAPEVPTERMFPNLRYLHGRVPNNAGMNIVVGSRITGFTRTMLRVFANAVSWKHGFDFADSVEEARRIIQRQRSTVKQV